MDFVPFSLIEGLQSLLQVGKVLLVLLLQFLQCILQGNLQLFLLLLKKLWRLKRANCKMKITGLYFSLGKTSLCLCYYLQNKTEEKCGCVSKTVCWAVISFKSVTQNTTWTSTAKRDRHKRQTHLMVAIICIVTEVRNKSSCRFIIESGDITAVVMIKAVKLVQYFLGSSRMAARLSTSEATNLLCSCCAV